MRRVAWLLLGAVGCANGGSDFADFPALPQEQGPELSSEANTLRGRVCVVDDVLALASCRTSSLANFAVSLGSATATTDETGTFQIEPIPRGSLLSFTVVGPGVVTTTTPFSPTLIIPVVNADVLAQALVAAQVTLPANTGTVIGTVVRNNATATGITVTSSSSAVGPTLYDADPSGFTTNATGARGIFLIPGIATGPTSLTLRDTSATGETTVAGIQVVNGGVTILDSLVIP